MKEVDRDEKWQNEPVELEAQISNSPTEAELVIVGLLTRIYDVLFTILDETNPEKANIVYETHERGETLGPPVYIPELNVE